MSAVAFLPQRNAAAAVGNRTHNRTRGQRQNVLFCGILPKKKKKMKKIALVDARAIMLMHTV